MRAVLVREPDPRQPADGGQVVAGSHDHLGGPQLEDRLEGQHEVIGCGRSRADEEREHLDLGRIDDDVFHLPEPPVAALDDGLADQFQGGRHVALRRKIPRAAKVQTGDTAKWGRRASPGPSTPTVRGETVAHLFRN